MKRITTLLLALTLVLGSVGAAKADGIDVKVKGTWDFAFGWADNLSFEDSVHSDVGGRSDDKFLSRQRFRTQVNFIAGEHLEGVLMFEIGNLDWGRSGKVGRGSGADLDADGVNIETKRAYLDWLIPNTEVQVRMGIQGLSLPMAVFSNPVFNDDVAGILVSSPITENVSIAAFWIRPFDAYANDNDGFTSSNLARDLDDETDVFGLILPLKFDGFSVTPWGMFGRVGNASGMYRYLLGEGFSAEKGKIGTNYDADTASAWWAGLSFELNVFDPLSFKMDAMYGRINRNNLSGLGGSNDVLGDVGAKGWFIAAALDYVMDWGTPGIFGWYSSGDDRDDVADDGWLGRMPVVGLDTGFAATSFGFANSYCIGTDGAVAISGTGLWGVGVQIADVSFVKDLSHTLRVTYYRGTNDADLVKDLGGQSFAPYSGDLYMTDEDSIWEVNFDHQYKIYENLTAVLELGYIHLKADRGTWDNARSGLGDESENAWKAQVLLRYQF